MGELKHTFKILSFKSLICCIFVSEMQRSFVTPLVDTHPSDLKSLKTDFKMRKVMEAWN
jgi:hypothetical protein